MLYNNWCVCVWCRRGGQTSIIAHHCNPIGFRINMTSKTSGEKKTRNINSFRTLETGVAYIGRCVCVRFGFHRVGNATQTSNSLHCTCTYAICDSIWGERMALCLLCSKWCNVIAAWHEKRIAQTIVTTKWRMSCLLLAFYSLIYTFFFHCTPRIRGLRINSFLFISFFLAMFRPFWMHENDSFVSEW